jgi:hypothetical protein
MKKVTRKYVFRAVLITTLASGPFVMRFLRKPKHLQESAIKQTVPSEMSSSGYLSMAEASFSPLALPDSNNIQYDSISACLSTDKDVILVSYSYGNDWKSRLCCASLSKKSVVGDFSTLLDIEKSWSFITSIGCSGIKNGWVSLVLRQCEPNDSNQSRCREVLGIAHLSEDRHGVFSLPADKINVACMYPNRLWLFKRAFTSSFLPNSHCWANGTDSLFFGRRWGVDKFRPNEDEPSALYARKVVSDFGEPESSPNRDTVNPQNLIRSNIYDNGNKTLSFVTAPRSFVESPYSEKELERYKKRGALGGIEQGLLTGDGNRIVVDFEGNLLSQISFPALPFYQLAQLTQTHYCFAHSRAGNCLISAPLEDPRNYTVFVFPADQLSIPTTKIPLVYQIHAVLPDGQSLLCSRNVGNSFIAEAKKKGFPLCELGIVKLPLSIG